MATARRRRCRTGFCLLSTWAGRALPGLVVSPSRSRIVLLYSYVVRRRIGDRPGAIELHWRTVPVPPVPVTVEPPAPTGEPAPPVPVAPALPVGPPVPALPVAEAPPAPWGSWSAGPMFPTQLGTAIVPASASSAPGRGSAPRMHL